MMRELYLGELGVYWENLGSYTIAKVKRAGSGKPLDREPNELSYFLLLILKNIQLLENKSMC